MFSAPLRHKGCEAIVTSLPEYLLPWVEVAVTIHFHHHLIMNNNYIIAHRSDRAL
jgi:hypothetical protein